MLSHACINALRRRRPETHGRAGSKVVGIHKTSLLTPANRHQDTQNIYTKTHSICIYPGIITPQHTDMLARRVARMIVAAVCLLGCVAEHASRTDEHEAQLTTPSAHTHTHAHTHTQRALVRQMEEAGSIIKLPCDLQTAVRAGMLCIHAYMHTQVHTCIH